MEVLDDTSYRRLVDQFDTYDQCAQDSDATPCYQTLTFCANGHVSANLDYRQQGRYQIRQGRTAVAHLPEVTVMWDLATASSPQLPGRHRWGVIEPIVEDCPTDAP